MKDLTDVSEFTEPVVVPEGFDSHDTLAEFIEALAQALANRTRYLKDQVGDYALKSTSNTFADVQIINTPAGVVDLPILSTQGKPEDATGLPLNRWKLELAFPMKGSAWSGIFTGQPPYGMAFVTNARWNVPAQQWRQLDAAYPSAALISTTGSVNGLFLFSYVPAGASGWTDWPTASADLIAGRDIGAGREFIYPAARLRTQPILLADVSGPASFPATGGVSMWLPEAFSVPALQWPIRLPFNPNAETRLGIVEIVVQQALGTSSWTAQLIGRHGAVWTAAPGIPTPPTPITIPASPVSVPGGGLKLLQIDASAQVIAADHDWCLEMRMTDTIDHTTDRVLAIRMRDWRDPGPINTL